MKHIKFYGVSDDLIEVEGEVPGCDEYNGETATFMVAGLRVKVAFERNGCWSVTACQIDEEVAVEAENVTLSVSSGGYAMLLEMDVPDGSYVTKASE